MEPTLMLLGRAAGAAAAQAARRGIAGQYIEVAAPQGALSDGGRMPAA